MAMLVEILFAPNWAELKVAVINDPPMLIVSMFSRFYVLKSVVAGPLRMAMRIDPDEYGASLTPLRHQSRSG